MLDADSTRMCYLLIFLVSLGFLIWGFTDTLRKQTDQEKSMEQTISRQIRGFAFILLSQVVLVLGMAMCWGLGGGRMRMPSF